MNMPKFLSVMILLFSSIFAVAQNTTSNERLFNGAIEQLKSNDTDKTGRAKAIAVIKNLAMRGYGKALNEMGVWYATGEIPEIDKDYKKAKDLLIKAWNAKEITAARNLSIIYSHDEYGPSDMNMVFEWTRKGAEAGDAQMMHDLGIYYMEPKYGFDVDTINAIGWYRKAAELEFGEAMWQLSRFYYNKGNTEEAKYWLKRGVEIDNVNCLYVYGLCLRDGDNGIEKDMNAAAENIKKAADTYGFEPAEKSFADICDNNKDYVTALQYYERSADKGNIRSMIIIADYHSQGRGNDIKIDYNAAFDWYSRGANAQPNTEDEHKLCQFCQTMVGLCYYKGWGVETDRQKGSSMLYRLAGEGYEKAKQFIKEYNVE